VNKALAQDYAGQADTFAKKLAEKGFENVSVACDKNDVYVFVENRVYRWEAHALGILFKEALGDFSDSTFLHIVPLHRQVPVTVISGRLKEYRGQTIPGKEFAFQGNLFDISFDTDSVKTIYSKIKPQNKSLRKIDIFLLPGFRVQFGNYDNPVEWQVNISPILQTSLWKGMLFTAQVLIPFHSELQQPGENKPKLGTVAVNQLLRLPKNVFLNLSTGVFAYANRITAGYAYQRYGFHADARKYLLNTRLCAGGYIGYTGQMLFSKGVLDYWPLDKLTLGLYGSYREPHFDVDTRLSAGKFLYNDFAIRLDISRQFKEASIGFFALKSDFGFNGGFNFIIPISPRKRFKPSVARVNIANYLKWEYTSSTVNPSATTYQTGDDLDETMRFFNTGYLKKQLQKGL
jgi:hypothetical protein